MMILETFIVIRISLISTLDETNWGRSNHLINTYFQLAYGSYILLNFVLGHS